MQRSGRMLEKTLTDLECKKENYVGDWMDPGLMYCVRF